MFTTKKRLSMFEKVNPSHPDKVADRIAGAMVDLAYQREKDPRVAVEVLIGHGYCYVIAESSVVFTHDDVQPIIDRIACKGITLRLLSKKQDSRLASNQVGAFRCGDNGIFKGAPVTDEQRKLAALMQQKYARFPFDGKAVLTDSLLTICQSNASYSEYVGDLKEVNGLLTTGKLAFNPLGYWTGGLDVDTGATNRKLGSDMGDGVTGGGLHGKDLSKADVSVNIYAHLQAQQIGKPVLMSCSIGDERVNGIPYAEIVETAREYIKALGGFERFAEWGLIR